jgi:hypothetical protein
MAGPPIYEDGFFELSIDRSQNSLDNTFKLRRQALSLLMKKKQRDFAINTPSLIAGYVKSQDETTNLRYHPKLIASCLSLRGSG